MSDTSDTSDTRSDGNTAKGIRSRHWCFTLNNPSKQHMKMCVDTTFGDSLISQYEKGDSETPHLQGYVYWKNARSKISCRKIFDGKAHWEVCRNIEASIEYCRKDEGRIQGPWTKKIPKVLKIIKNLRAWQWQVIDDIDFDDDRTINWYYDEAGGLGKTTLAKYIVKKYNALYTSGKAADVKYGVTEWKDKNDLIIIWDLARSQESFFSYQGLEEVKNGIFFNTKYESKMVNFNSPHVIVFANWRPDEDMLSADRWNIVDVAEL